MNEWAYYCDSSLRDSLAGEIDFVFIGDSDGMTAFSPKEFDRITGMNSYNLSGSMVTYETEEYLLKKELARNPVESVVIQISHDMLSRKPSSEHADGDSVTYQRLRNPTDRMKFLFGCVPFHDWFDLESRLLITGFSNWKEALTNGNIEKCDTIEKGHRNRPIKDQTLNEDQIISLYNSEQISTSYEYEFYKEYIFIANMCKLYGCKVYFVVLPLPDYEVWKKAGWDDFSQYVNEHFSIEDVTVIDFNLLKERYNLFSDAESFVDAAHFSVEGSKQFTDAFSKLYLDIKFGKNISSRFYDSYEVMKNDSPYRKKLEQMGMQK